MYSSYSVLLLDFFVPLVMEIINYFKFKTT